MTAAKAWGMASLIATPALNAKVYRHFAGVTLAITACVALFANGEARQAIGDELTEREQRAAFERASTEKFGKAKLGDRRKLGRGGGRFGREEAVHDQQAEFDDAGGSDQDAPIALGSEAGGAPDGEGLAAATPDEIEAMTPEQRAAYLATLRQQRTPQVPTAATVSREQISALMAASSARSGSEGIE